MSSHSFGMNADAWAAGSGSSGEDEKVENGEETPPKKIAKRLCRFNPSWQTEFTW
jgi:hypothetical protein